MAQGVDGKKISIHAPRTGSDLPQERNSYDNRQFQSTLPARGATRILFARYNDTLISIHAPRTGSDTGKLELHFDKSISIHAPRTGSDMQRVAQTGVAVNFNPRSPHGERHELKEKLCEELQISIHAPRTGSDAFPLSRFAPPYHFNPRSPHGERPCWISAASSSLIFQSTLPARGATVQLVRRRDER